jgi:D-alanyl-lipoteichoic acid acyltransferase DltB (MBOAT superfamily)
MALAPIVLPLAISFFTFQQISYLVDAYSGSNTAHDFLDYCLYVTFFPQLIAGPIVRSSEMLPQYTETRPTVFRHEHLSVGLTLFFIGLFKKVGLADGIAFYATPMFQAADAGQAIPFFDAWLGSLAYTLQLYFDFSGYSDMAVGLARMFGFYLPINFNSPYKANSVIDFWRRWHMTLSRFMLDYLYIPLGGNRKGQVRHYLNLMVTMLLGGLWHGASWNFVIWGGMQGMYLAINHAWENFRKLLGLSGQPFAYKLMARTLTFLALIWAWVIFRAETLPGAMEIYRGMLGMNGFVLDYSWAHKLGSLFPVTESLGWTLGIEIINQDRALVRSLLLLSVIWFLPNSIQWFQKYNPVLNPPREWDATARWPWIWQPHIAWALVILSGAVYTIFEMTTVSEFLYFQF